MMNYYVNIKLITDSDISLGFLWKKIYAQLHLALVEVRDKDNMVSVGLSFPNYSKDRYLGDSIRIFAPSEEELERLDLYRWLGMLLDYINLSEIKSTPRDKVEYVSFGRKQLKTNPERLARRQAKRKGISYEEALKNYEDFDVQDKENDNRLPYINANSLSSDKTMKIFIKKSEPRQEKIGRFSTYGLSNETTTPWF